MTGYAAINDRFDRRCRQLYRLGYRPSFAAVGDYEPVPVWCRSRRWQYRDKFPIPNSIIMWGPYDVIRDYIGQSWTGR